VTHRKRTLRRAQARAQAALARDLERLALLGPGGSPERAIVITSPAEVEVQARATPCPVCRGELRVDEHTAETTTSGLRVRVARVTCPSCGRRGAIYFRLVGTMIN
jgi:hypothetical protein